MGVVDMVVYRVKKLIAWAIAIAVLTLIVAGVYFIITL